MSNMSSDFDNNFSGEQSHEVVQAGKYIKKMKTLSKKNHKTNSSHNKKSRCEFYNVGLCRKGTLCTSSHSFIPDVAKVPLLSFRKSVRHLLGRAVIVAIAARTPTTQKDTPASISISVSTASTGHHAPTPTKKSTPISRKNF